MSRRHSKYNVSPPEERRFYGRTYASKAECEYAQSLFKMREDGLIADFMEQPTCRLGVAENVYRPDFLILPSEPKSQPFFIDVKGHETASFKRNKKLWASHGWLDLCVVKKFGGKFITTEVVHGRHSHPRDKPAS